MSIWTSNKPATDETTDAQPVTTSAQPAAATVDPRVEFADKLIEQATAFGFYRSDAVRIIQQVMPEYKPQHPSLAKAKAYADQLAPAGSVNHQAFVAVYLAGVDNR